jgi:hypothetical protein
VLEEVLTALAAGFDIVAGITVLALLTSEVEHLGRHFAHVVGALGFGIGFIFLIVGGAREGDVAEPARALDDLAALQHAARSSPVPSSPR